MNRRVFPSGSRIERRRRVRNFWLWLLGGALLVGGVAGVLYLVYQQAQM